MMPILRFPVEITAVTPFRAPRREFRRRAMVLAIVVLAVLAAGSAAAIECPTRSLPRPDEAYEVTRARLEAAGQWFPSGNPALTPPLIAACKDVAERS